MIIVAVRDTITEEAFYQLPKAIYKNDPKWISPLIQDIKKVFDPTQNKYHDEGEITRWILQEDGTTIGRIAAFIHRKLSMGFEQPTGGIGFFECIDNQNAANLLFDTAKEWLQTKGMEAMDGPINFGEKDNWWGLLIWANTEVMYGMSYNPPYYIQLFENYGFKDYYKQFNYLYDIANHPLPPKFEAKAKLLEADPDYLFTHMKGNDYVKCAEDFRTIYNNAWAKGHFNFKPMSKEMGMNIMKKLKPIADKKIMLFGYHKDQPIAMFIMIPELNQIFKHVNGNLNWLGKLKFVWHKMILKSNRKAMGIMFAVDPAYQGIGAEAALIREVERILRGHYKRYDTMEMTWIAEFNPKMIHMVEGLEVPISKVRITYRYLFDRAKPFTRHPIVGTTVPTEETK
jgi:GNAT superfamily N-acetyltransferase